MGFLVNKAHVEVGLEVPHSTTLQIFWAKEGRWYTEGKMTDIFVHPGSKHYRFILTDLTEIAKLRIDPSRYAGKAKLLYLKIYQGGFQPVELTGASGLEELQPFNQVAELYQDTSGLAFTSLGNDPGLELFLDLTPVDAQWFSPDAAEMFFLIVITWLLGVICSSLLIRYRYVLLLLAGAWMLIWVMAVTSKQNSHPDEYVHLSATTWYQDNWLPPEIESPAIRNTYSVYGYSRLNSWEMYYLLAGKFQKIMTRLSLNGLQGLRLINVMFFGTFLVAAVAFPCVRLVALPFLISPQIWYVFSYCNSDAFGLAVCFLTCCELVCKGSVFNRFLNSRSVPRLLLSSLYLGCVAAALLLLKHNYYPFIGVAAVFIMVQRILPADRQSKCALLYRLAAVVVIGLIFFGARLGAAYYVNGFDRAEKISAMHEATAQPLYSLKTPAAERMFSMSLKERGVSLDTIVDKYNWFQKSFMSSFGVYGYFTVKGSVTYYQIVKAVALFLLLFLLISVLWRGGTGERLMVLSIILFSCALVFSSLYHSWVVDLQPQGRYLLAIIPMLALLYADSHRLVNRTVMSAGVIVLFVLSGYSFIYYGLMQLPGIVS
ncbi:MAG: hypothetical protein ACN4GW_14875 [Desulforhopalus sp.]